MTVPVPAGHSKALKTDLKTIFWSRVNSDINPNKLGMVVQSLVSLKPEPKF